MKKFKDTSWEKVANWYDSYLQQGGKQGNSLYQSIIVPNLKRLLNKLEKTAVNGTLLDAASGQGIISRLASKVGFKVTAFDKSKSLIELAKKAPDSKSSIKYVVADAREAHKTFTKEKFDVITCVLALQNIPEADIVVSSLTNLLSAQGKLVIVINHPAFRIPRQSDWGWDDKSKLQFRRINLYQTELSIPINSKPFKSKFNNNRGQSFAKNEVTWSYHRPMAYYFENLTAAGLKVEKIEEWYSERISEPGPKAKAENRARSEFPLFLCMVASK